MVRRNEDGQLKALKLSLNEWWQIEFGREIDKQFISAAIESMILEQKEKFCFKRIGHLSGEDLMAFKEIWNEEPISKETIEVAEGTRVAGQSEESLPDAGKGVRSGRNIGSKRHSADGSKKDNRG